MRDFDVRIAVRKRLCAQYANDPKTRIVEEMGVWSGSVRIDLAVINGRLHGFELKSARDTLERLPHQAILYSQVFDKVTLVTSENHLAKAKRIVPPWWGILQATQSKRGPVTLKSVRVGRANRDISAVQICRLLWRSELLCVLERYALDRGYRSKSVEQMTVRLAETLPLDVLKREVRRILQLRLDWLGEPVGYQ